MLYHKYCFLTKKINYVNIKCLKLNGKSFQYSYYILQSSPSLPVHGEEDTTAQIVGSELIQDVSLCKYSAWVGIIFKLEKTVVGAVIIMVMNKLRKQS